MIDVIAILLIVCLILCLWSTFCQSDKRRFLLCLIVTTLITTIFVLFSFYLRETPTAMDVYRGDATLQYTVRDGQIVDSTAVFKKQ